MIKSKNQQGGAVLVVVIIGILAIIAAVAIFGGMSQEARRCANTLRTIEYWNNQWINSKQGGSPDVGICNQMNVLIQNYNRTCGKKYGNTKSVPKTQPIAFSPSTKTLTWSRPLEKM